MDEKRQKELELLEQKVKARQKYVNEYQKNKYDRIICLLPKGQREQIENRMTQKNIKTISDYLRSLIDDDLKKAD